jgi:hypothetical protein
MAKESSSKEVVNYDAYFQAEREAQVKRALSVTTNNFFSIKSGVLSYAGQAIPENQMAVLVLADIFENVNYPDDYDPENPENPNCFAFGTEPTEMKPHEVSMKAGTYQNDTCIGCPMNEFGTADRGRGKHCKNIVRLAVISCGSLKGNTYKQFAKPELLQAVQIGFLKVPVTSVKTWTAFSVSSAEALQTSSQLIATRIKVVPDAANQFAVTFEALGVLPQAFYPVVHQKVQEAKKTIYNPYAPYAERVVEKKPVNRKIAPKKTGAKPVTGKTTRGK